MIIRGTELEAPAEYRADVIVVGSGAGGAVVARELAEQGLDVLVLEEGPYVSPDVYGKWRPMQTFRRMARAGGSTVAVGLGKNPTVNVLAGACVGGSSTLTGGVCFRVPEAVHEEWVEILDTDTISARSMEAVYARVEDMIHVEEVPVEMQSRGTVLFGQGAKKLGYDLKPLRRNTKGCCGCSRCNFGCPNKAKLSVDLTYLPRAMELGARIAADHRVDRLIVKDGRVLGVEGRTLSDPDRKPSHRFRALADTVVLAAGALHTPHLLLRSRVGNRSRQVGRNLTLHPSFRTVAIFDEDVRGWRGALQSAYSDHFESQRITLVSAYAPPSVLAAGLPNFGPEYMERARNAVHFASFGFLVHDEPGGRVRRGLGREPVVTYDLASKDRAAIIEGFRIMGRTFLAAGAREVLLPIFGSNPVRNEADVLRTVHDKLDMRRIESLSFHPLGTCRMGRDGEHSVCDAFGHVHDVAGLWLADGSVVPTSLGVNSQLPIMAMATRIAFELLERRRRNVSAA
jgi:choline dehydrogenase-like flavoprotein